MSERKINLEEIIEDCNKNNIESKMLRGFGVDVDSDHEFIFIKKLGLIVVLLSLVVIKFVIYFAYKLALLFPIMI